MTKETIPLPNENDAVYQVENDVITNTITGSQFADMLKNIGCIGVQRKQVETDDKQIAYCLLFTLQDDTTFLIQDPHPTRNTHYQENK